ncbi:MAG: hypothetical protein U0570_01075 [Phycisphaerales bacterium]
MNAHTPPANDGADPQVDAVQQQVMRDISPDGRPPPLPTVRSEWKWFIIATAILGLAAIVVLFLSLGAAAGFLAIILLAGYIGLTVPVWGAGLLRGREERDAKVAAQNIVIPDEANR